MMKPNTPVEEGHFTFEVCMKEVPVNEVDNPEVADYVLHFCGLECYEEWKHQQEKQDDLHGNAVTLD